MEKFLVDNKNALVSNDASYSFVHVVIGNEACDLDSTISALTYAYYLNQTKADDRTLYVPVLNIPCDDLCLRTETVYTLNKFKLSPECLTFRDQVDLHSILASGRLRTTVVDFHVFPTADDALTSSIVEIIDHRPKQKLNFEGVKVTIDIVGSCCTLVAEKLIANTKFRFNTTVAGLLHATILVDTICLNPEAKKVTRRDIAAVTHLENYIPTSDRKTVFNDIQTAKMNLSALSNLEIMRKDLKIVTSNSFVVAISSIPIHLEEFLQRPKVESDMLKFLSLKKADAVMIMAVAPAEDDMIERQLAIFSANHSLRDKITIALQAFTVPSLDLIPIQKIGSKLSTFMLGNDEITSQQLVRTLQRSLNLMLNAGLPAKSQSTECDDLDLSDQESSGYPVTPNTSYEQNGPLNAFSLPMAAVTSRPSLQWGIRSQFSIDRDFGNFGGETESEPRSDSSSTTVSTPTPDAPLCPDFQKEAATSAAAAIDETDFDRYSRENSLPSFWNAEIMDKIRAKRRVMKEQYDWSSIGSGSIYTPPCRSIAEEDEEPEEDGKRRDYRRKSWTTGGKKSRRKDAAKRDSSDNTVSDNKNDEDHDDDDNDDDDDGDDDDDVSEEVRQKLEKFEEIRQLRSWVERSKESELLLAFSDTMVESSKLADNKFEDFMQAHGLPSLTNFEKLINVEQKRKILHKYLSDVFEEEDDDCPTSPDDRHNKYNVASSKEKGTSKRIRKQKSESVTDARKMTSGDVVARQQSLDTVLRRQRALVPQNSFSDLSELLPDTMLPCFRNTDVVEGVKHKKRMLGILDDLGNEPMTPQNSLNNLMNTRPEGPNFDPDEVMRRLHKDAEEGAVKVQPIRMLPCVNRNNIDLFDSDIESDCDAKNNDNLNLPVSATGHSNSWSDLTKCGMSSSEEEKTTSTDVFYQEEDPSRAGSDVPDIRTRDRWDKLGRQITPERSYAYVDDVDLKERSESCPNFTTVTSDPGSTGRHRPLKESGLVRSQVSRKLIAEEHLKTRSNSCGDNPIEVTDVVKAPSAIRKNLFSNYRSPSWASQDTDEEDELKNRPINVDEMVEKIRRASLLEGFVGKKIKTVDDGSGSSNWQKLGRHLEDKSDGSEEEPAAESNNTLSTTNEKWGIVGNQIVAADALRDTSSRADDRWAKISHSTLSPDSGRADIAKIAEIADDVCCQVYDMCTGKMSSNVDVCSCTKGQRRLCAVCEQANRRKYTRRRSSGEDAEFVSMVQEYVDAIIHEAVDICQRKYYVKRWSEGFDPVAEYERIMKSALTKDDDSTDDISGHVEKPFLRRLCKRKVSPRPGSKVFFHIDTPATDSEISEEDLCSVGSEPCELSDVLTGVLACGNPANSNLVGTEECGLQEIQFLDETYYVDASLPRDQQMFNFAGVFVNKVIEDAVASYRDKSSELKNNSLNEKLSAVNGSVDIYACENVSRRDSCSNDLAMQIGNLPSDFSAKSSLHKPVTVIVSEAQSTDITLQTTSDDVTMRVVNEFVNDVIAQAKQQYNVETADKVVDYVIADARHIVRGRDKADQLAREVIDDALGKFVDKLVERGYTVDMLLQCQSYDCLKQDQQLSRGSSLSLDLSATTLETEYLSSCDPFHGNMDIVSSPDRSFATSASLEIVESSSFRRMRRESGIFDDLDFISESEQSCGVAGSCVVANTAQNESLTSQEKQAASGQSSKGQSSTNRMDRLRRSSKDSIDVCRSRQQRNSVNTDDSKQADAGGSRRGSHTDGDDRTQGSGRCHDRTEGDMSSCGLSQEQLHAMLLDGEPDDKVDSESLGRRLSGEYRRRSTDLGRKSSIELMKRDFGHRNFSRSVEERGRRRSSDESRRSLVKRSVASRKLGKSALRISIDDPESEGRKRGSVTFADTTEEIGVSSTLLDGGVDDDTSTPLSNALKEDGCKGPRVPGTPIVKTYTSSKANRFVRGFESMFSSFKGTVSKDYSTVPDDEDNVYDEDDDNKDNTSAVTGDNKSDHLATCSGNNCPEDDEKSEGKSESPKVTSFFFNWRSKDGKADDGKQDGDNNHNMKPENVTVHSELKSNAASRGNQGNKTPDADCNDDSLPILGRVTYDTGSDDSKPVMQEVSTKRPEVFRESGFFSKFMRKSPDATSPPSVKTETKTSFFALITGRSQDDKTDQYSFDSEEEYVTERPSFFSRITGFGLKKSPAVTPSSESLPNNDVDDSGELSSLLSKLSGRSPTVRKVDITEAITLSEAKERSESAVADDSDTLRIISNENGPAVQINAPFQSNIRSFRKTANQSVELNSSVDSESSTKEKKSPDVFKSPDKPEKQPWFLSRLSTARGSTDSCSSLFRYDESVGDTENDDHEVSFFSKLKNKKSVKSSATSGVQDNSRTDVKPEIREPSFLSRFRTLSRSSAGESMDSPVFPPRIDEDSLFVDLKTSRSSSRCSDTLEFPTDRHLSIRFSYDADVESVYDDGEASDHPFMRYRGSTSSSGRGLVSPAPGVCYGIPSPCDYKSMHSDVLIMCDDAANMCDDAAQPTAAVSSTNYHQHHNDNGTSQNCKTLSLVGRIRGAFDRQVLQRSRSEQIPQIDVTDYTDRVLSTERRYSSEDKRGASQEETDALDSDKRTEIYKHARRLRKEARRQRRLTQIEESEQTDDAQRQGPDPPPPKPHKKRNSLENKRKGSGPTSGHVKTGNHKNETKPVKKREVVRNVDGWTIHCLKTRGKAAPPSNVRSQKQQDNNPRIAHDNNKSRAVGAAARKRFVKAQTVDVGEMSMRGGVDDPKSKREIFFTTAGKISIQVDSFDDPDWDPDTSGKCGNTTHAETIPEEDESATGTGTLPPGTGTAARRYSVDERLLESADKLCDEADERVAMNSSLTNQSEEDFFDSPDVVIAEVTNDQLESNPKATRPASLPTNNNNVTMRAKKKIMPGLDIDFSHDRFPSMTEEDQQRSLDRLDSIDAMDDIPTPDDLDTPDLDDLDYGDDFTGELEWDDDDSPHMEEYETTTTSSSPMSPPGVNPGYPPIPEYTAQEERENERHWRTVHIAEKKYKVDMKVIEPFKRVLSHGGYYGNGANAIVVFASCYLPDRSRADYRYVMDNLFLYIISTLELLVADDYMIVYFHGSTPRSKMPQIGWMRRCYQMIDRRLRKNLKTMLLVHPTFWIKTITLMTRPFISSKFYSKIKYIYSLKDLSDIVPMEYLFVPEPVQQFDQLRNKNRPNMSWTSPISSTRSTPITSPN